MGKNRKKPAKAKSQKGKQLDLIDIHGKDVKPIVDAAREYKEYQAARLAAGKKEDELKQLILELAEKAELQRLAKGIIRFEFEGVEIEITPRDSLVKVKNKANKN